MKILNFIIVFFIILNFNNNLYSKNSVVYLNVNYIFNSSNSGSEMNKLIEKKIKKLENKVKIFSDKIEIKKDEIIKQKNIISKTEYNKKFKIVDDEIKVFNSKIKEENNEINKIRKEARLNFTTALQKILADYSAQNSIDLIINQENILVGNKKLDISEDILKAVNEKKIKLTK